MTLAIMGNNMKKVIIRTREDELTVAMYRFGNNCAKQFIDSVEREEYGKDWNECSYLNENYKMSCWVKINKSGTVSACVFNKGE